MVIYGERIGGDGLSKLVISVLVITDIILLVIVFLHRNFLSQHGMIPTIIFYTGCSFAGMVSIITKRKRKINTKQKWVIS